MKAPSVYTLTWLPVDSVPATNDWKRHTEETVQAPRKQSFVQTGRHVIYIANGRPLENSYLVRLPVLDRCSIPHYTIVIKKCSRRQRTVANPKSLLFDDSAEHDLVRLPAHPYITPQGMGTPILI